MFKLPLDDDTLIRYAASIYENPSCTSEEEFLDHKSEEKYYSYIKTFLLYLNSLPNKIPELDLETVAPDHRIEQHLRNLK